MNTDRQDGIWHKFRGSMVCLLVFNLCVHLCNSNLYIGAHLVYSTLL